MNDTPTNSQVVHEKARNALIDAIVFRIEQDVDDAIPPDVLEDVRKLILGEILPNSRFVLEASSVEQLQNECALDRHIDGAIATATYLVHRIAAQRSRS